MKEQDKRAVESMCRCGLSLDAITACFPMFPKKEIKAVFDEVQSGEKPEGDGGGISINCS